MSIYTFSENLTTHNHHLFLSKKEYTFRFGRSLNILHLCYKPTLSYRQSSTFTSYVRNDLKLATAFTKRLVLSQLLLQGASDCKH